MMGRGGPTGMMGGGGTPGMRSRGGGPPGGGFRGGGPPGGGDSGDRLARFEGFLRSMDANGNGVIEEREVPEERRRMISGIAERLGLEVKDGGVAISKIREAAERRSEEREREKESEKSEKEQEPLVPGFGVEQQLARVPAVGEPVEDASVVTLGASKGSSAAGADPEREARMRGFAQMMIRRADRNGSGALEKDEWGGMRNDPTPADRNKNGVITAEELAAWMVNRSRGGSDQGGSNGSGSNGSGTESSGRRTNRFLTATERLSDDLPGWFLDSDDNSDGQVAMAEYASYWTEEQARKFNRYDHNHDGLITERECLKGPAESEDLGAGTGGPAGEAPREEAPKKEEPGGEEKPWWEL